MTCAQYYLQCIYIYIYLHTEKIQCTQIILHDGWCSSRYRISTCKEHLSIPKGKQNSARWIDDQCTLYGKCMQMLWCFFSHQLQESFGSLAGGAIVAKRYPMVRKVPKYKTVPVPPMTPQLQPTTQWCFRNTHKWCQCLQRGVAPHQLMVHMLIEIYHLLLTFMLRRKKDYSISEVWPCVFTHDITYHMTTHAITYVFCHHKNIFNAIKCCPTAASSNLPSPAPQPGSRLILSIPVDKGLKYFPFSAMSLSCKNDFPRFW